MKLSLFTLIPLLAAMSTGAAVILSDNKVTATIITASDATGPEQMAANELAEYLHRISGAQYGVQSETTPAVEGSRLYVGPTKFAASKGLSPGQLGPEEWIIRTFGRDLVIIGGRPRGTIYGAYHFLEDVLGVHWWNPFEESVPGRKEIHIRALDLKGQPAIRYRDIYMLYGQDAGRFAAHNRLNRDGDAKIDARYGGSRDYGPPYHVHTFGWYFPPKEFFSPHPEWYSLIDGKRVADGSQLCLTQPELRKAFLAKLLRNIKDSWAAAKAAGAPPPLVFSISQNDCLNPCHCANCQAIAKTEESECGPLLDFVNYLADGVRGEYPEVFIDTLAYQYTQKAPRTIRPRDNVVVRLCDTESDPTQPITSEVNHSFRQELSRWAEIAQNLRVWDYAVTYASPVGMPMPTVQTYGPDYRFYAAHHVEGVFTELEFEILADMRDLKIWLMMKQLEDPSADYKGLLETFTDGFYGRAGKYVRRYLHELENEARARGTKCNWNSAPQSLSYLNLRFVNRAQALFDKAERAARPDGILLRRVRHARLPIDRATLAVYPRLVSEWLALGKPADNSPPNRETAGERALDTWISQAKLRLPAAAQETEKQRAEAEIRRYAALPTSIALPEKFQNLPRGSIYDYLATMTRNWADVVKVVKDPEAESGMANKLDLTDASVESAEKYNLPMPWGLYGTADKKSLSGKAIRLEDIPGPGYHWYKMGSYTIPPGYYIYFFWSWIIQVDVDNVYDPTDPGREFDVWARIKFEGPRFPHTRPAAQNAIYVERVVLIKKPKDAQ